MSEKRELLDAVRAFVSAHPDDLSAVMNAVSAGAMDAIYAAQMKAGKAHAAVLSALALTSKKAIGADLRRAMEAHVVAAIDPRNAAPIERAFLASVDPAP